MDQPLKALDLLTKNSEENPSEIYFKLYKARIYEMVCEYNQSISLYNTVLELDPCNFESIACIASHYFYSDHPEIAMKFYKRLFELGISSAEIWNNLGLCSYYSGQYDFCLSCFERGLLYADDENASDLWFNISHVALGIGDVGLAYQALKIAVQYNKESFESLNNLGILENRKGNINEAKSNFSLACKSTDFSFEPYFNLSLIRFKQGDYEEAHKFVMKSLEIFPNHVEGGELLMKIKQILEN